MPENFAGPYILQIVQQTDGLEHVLNFNCAAVGDPAIGEDFANISFATKDGGQVTGVNAVNDLLGALAPLHANATVFGGIELYRAVGGTNQRQFISSSNQSANGSAGLPYVPAHYSMYTFRSSLSGIMRVTLLEDVNDDFDQKVFASLGTNQQALVNYVLDDQCILNARDNGVPIAFLRVSAGNNDSIERARFR